jgi:hypothetical protein
MVDYPLALLHAAERTLFISLHASEGCIARFTPNTLPGRFLVLPSLAKQQSRVSW